MSRSLPRTPTSQNRSLRVDVLHGEVPLSSLARLSGPDAHLTPFVGADSDNGDDSEEKTSFNPPRKPTTSDITIETHTGHDDHDAKLTTMLTALLRGQQTIKSTLEEQKSRLDALESTNPSATSIPSGLQLQGLPANVRSTTRAKQVIARAAAANISKLGMDSSTQAKLDDLMSHLDDEEEDGVSQPPTHTTRTQRSHTHDQSEQKSSSSEFRSALMPLKGSEKQDLASLLAEAVTVKAKSTKKFKDLEHLLKEMEEQLGLFINEDGYYSSRVRCFLQYAHMLTKMASDRGIDAVNFYHWKLFERIGEGRHDTEKEGYQATDLLIDVKTTYTSLPVQKSKKVSDHTSHTQPKKSFTKSNSNPNANSHSNRTTNPSPNTGSFPAGSCPTHPTSTTHNQAGCRLNSNYKPPRSN